MDTDTCHRSLRTQRCLPVEFHTEKPTLTYRETGLTSPFDVSPTQWFPKSRLRVVVALLPANSRFFTDCYPISAVFAPGRAAISHRKRPPNTSHPDHRRSIYHFSFNGLDRFRGLRRGTTKRVPVTRPEPFSIAKIETSFRLPAVAGKRGYQDGHHPVAPRSQVPIGRGRPSPGELAAEHTPIPENER